MQALSLCLLLLLALLSSSVSSVQDDANLLSDKELQLIRYMSYLTFLQTTTTTNHSWGGWERNVDNAQLDLAAIRYPLAHIGYTAAALAHRTANYRELAATILRDCIERMLLLHVWDYVEHYWSKTPTFPDPVRHENIMYSGHLLQLLTLYESISGDFTYDTEGFDFVWNKTGEPVVTMHYTTSKLAMAIYSQMDDESSAGVSCEPDWVYTICQSHPHLGFRLYDVVRDGRTNFSRMTAKWKDFLISHALEDIPMYKQNRYFKMLYERKTHVWVPFFASTGNDGWTLAWLSSWFDNNHTSNFVCRGWQVMYNNKFWTPSGNQSAPGCFLDAGGYIGVRMQLNSWLATSFYPIIEKQCSATRTEKLDCAYAWFENNFGRRVDTDHDGFLESFYYETDTVYSNWVTANVLLSLIIGESGDKTRDFLRNVYMSKFYAKFLEAEPEVMSVQYPTVRVARAQYDAAGKTLVINFSTEKPTLLTTSFDVKYPSAALQIANVTRDGSTSGFTLTHVSDDRAKITYAYESVTKQQTQFDVRFQ